MTCQHEIWERETAVADGMCPLCMAKELERLQAEVQDWRECARYDPLMSGPAFKGWDRSHMDRCRNKYIENPSTGC